MVSTFLRLPRLPAKEPADYVDRCGRMARSVIQKSGFWKAFEYIRAVSWDEHLLNLANSHIWLAKLRGYHNNAWLQARRHDSEKLAREIFTARYRQGGKQELS